MHDINVESINIRNSIQIGKNGSQGISAQSANLQMQGKTPIAAGKMGPQSEVDQTAKSLLKRKPVQQDSIGSHSENDDEDPIMTSLQTRLQLQGIKIDKQRQGQDDQLYSAADQRILQQISNEVDNNDSNANLLNGDQIKSSELFGIQSEIIPLNEDG